DGLSPPAHEVAGGEVGVTQHEIERAATGPAVHRGDQADRRRRGAWQSVRLLEVVELGPSVRRPIVRLAPRAPTGQPDRVLVRLPVRLVDETGRERREAGRIEVLPV